MVSRGKITAGFLLSLLLLLLVQGAVAGPKIQSWNTANGAKVLFVAASDLPIVDMRVVFDAGSARDGATPGISHLTNGLLTEGAGDWDANRIAERLESVGAELGSGALRDMGWVSIRTLSEPKALATSVETMATILGKPTFAEDALERNRQMMLAGLERLEQAPGKVAKRRFYKEVFGDHPYGVHGGGTRESLAGFSTDDLRAFHRRYYVAANAVVAIVGDLDRKGAEELAERLTAQLQRGEHAPELPQVAALGAGKEVRETFPSSQSHIFLGQPGMKRGDPDYFPLYVGNHILGGSGLVSLLAEEVREKRGLSYSVYSQFSPMRVPGPFVMGAQTQNAKADEALQVMRHTLNRFVEQGPTAEELDAAKKNITGGFPLRIASNSDIVSYLGMIGFYGLPLDHLDTLVAKVNRVTTEQIKDAFRRRVHPDRLVTVVVGSGNAE
jgi:zinc protease